MNFVSIQQKLGTISADVNSRPSRLETRTLTFALNAAACVIPISTLLTGGWGDFEGPLCVGHEIVGRVVTVGKGVTSIKEGDRVGVGAQMWACLKCDACKSRNENYCPHWVGMYFCLAEDVMKCRC